MPKQRDLSIDALKGLCILCIFFLHYSNSVLSIWSYVWISRFMVSAFYFTSGWVNAIYLKPLSIKDLWSKRLYALGRPYLFFSIIIICFDVLWYVLGYYDSDIILKDIYKAITLRGIGTLWFLPALIGGEFIVFYLLNKNRRIYWLSATLLSLLYIYLYDYWVDNYRNLSTINQLIDAPLITLSSIFKAWPVILSGFFFAEKFNQCIEHSNKVKVFGIGLSITIISIFLSDSFLDLDVLNYFVTPILAPLGLLYILKSLGKLDFIISFLTYFGRNSLIIMLTHYSIIQVICVTITESYFTTEFKGIITVYFFMASIIVEIIIITIINKYFPFLIGKK